PRMPRRILFILVLAATIVAACGGSPTAPALTDPKDILLHAASSLQTTRTVHLKVTLAGKLDTGLITGKPTGARVDLAGSTLEGDVDIAGREMKLSASVPALLGLSGELLVDAGTVYVRTSLTGPKFQKLDPNAIFGGQPLPSLPPAASPDPSAVAAMIATLKAQLDQLPAPVKLADEKIGDQDCYHVQAKVTSADVPQASGVMGDLSGAMTIDVWTRKSDYRPARLVIAVDGGTSGTATITVDLTGYDAAVTVDPPPADQLSDQPFTIPSLPFLP
ncbi:MAG: hypothetical protein M3P84_06535, partial [Chloroflexota bacterium]|nr:hypothetical protein [Chloroflexota bacterium]